MSALPGQSLKYELIGAKPGLGSMSVNNQPINQKQIKWQKQRLQK
jgi:hypothetical protein